MEEHRGSGDERRTIVATGGLTSTFTTINAPGTHISSTVTQEDLDALQRAIATMQVAMENMSYAVDSVNDALYTVQRGGRAFSVDTATIEEEAEAEYVRDHPR